MKALEENNGYEIFILTPPPINFLISPLFLVAFSPRALKKMAAYFNNFLFWLENMFLLICFFFYMLAHSPLIIAKTYYQLTKINGCMTKLGYTILWTFFGFFFMIYISIVDTCMLMNILCLDNSIVFDQSEEEKIKLERHKYYIYRDIIRSIE